ncbi:MAG TPA: cysteine--tRNA ligase [Alphaproteobacteria bacterium]|nr:cysteine--tRNA ligase [Alphaproteobacteria bacterium]
MKLNLYNTLTAQKDEFKPEPDKKVRMYVCGPTVYERPHIGNARAVVVYDLLFRILREIYGENSVTYVRNITDVDDKINKAAIENKESIQSLTTRITGLFHSDMAALNNLPPTHEPRATEYISQIIELIEKIIANGHAYVAEGHVLYDINSTSKIADYSYGMLSGKKLEDLIAGARIEVEKYKRNAGDFVLWKPADKDDDASSVFDSPWGKGRPGWHIECSAMSSSLLGDDFDIHGGGADLKFPHHENEIAQSKAANHKCHYAKFWVHNGFVTVNGEKMSKSLGNFTTVSDLLNKGVKGEVIRLALLMTHYRKPLDFNEKLLEDAEKSLDRFYRALEEYQKILGLEERVSDDDTGDMRESRATVQNVISRNYSDFLKSIYDDMNVSTPISMLYSFCSLIPRAKNYTQQDSYERDLQDWKDKFDKMRNLLGIVQQKPEDWFAVKKSKVDVNFIEAQIKARTEAKKNKDYQLADKIRLELEAMGITLKDTKDGTIWE